MWIEPFSLKEVPDEGYIALQGNTYRIADEVTWDFVISPTSPVVCSMDLMMVMVMMIGLFGI
jgi:hypothetical protein